MTRSRIGRTVPLGILSMLALGQGCPDSGGNGGTGGANGGGLPPENARVATQSQCAQNVITCTVTFPKARIQVIAGPGQVVTPTAKGFTVQGSNGNGSETVNLLGSTSTAGQGATQIFYSWSQGASDSNPLTLNPGTQFSTQPNPSVLMKKGLHYVRLTVTNDIFRDEITAPTGEVILRNVFQSDFVEVEIDVQD